LTTGRVRENIVTVSVLVRPEKLRVGMRRDSLIEGDLSSTLKSPQRTSSLSLGIERRQR
jgi:hypothetical protein